MSDDILKLVPKASVTVLETITSLPIAVERVLAGAADANLVTCHIVGEDAEGNFYFASTTSDGPNVLWDLEVAKQRLLNA